MRSMNERTQVHPSTGKAIRQVKVVKVEGETATVKALNGPMRGAVYTVSVTVLK